MAVTKKNRSYSNESNFFIVPLEKKKKIFGIFLSLFSLLLFLSILSYSSSDLPNLRNFFSDLTEIFSPGQETLSRFQDTNNWLGIFGAYFSNFLINSTIGYFSIVVPVILFIWGYAVISNEDFRLSVYLSNFLITIGVILSTFFGMLKTEFDVLLNQREFYGNIGEFFGQALARLFGGLGSIIFLITLLFVVFFIAFDIKIENIFNRLKSLWKDSFSEGVSGAEKKEKEAENNLSKIKKLRKENKNKGARSSEEESFDTEIVEPREPKETKIRIIKRDEPEKLIEPEVEDYKPEEKKISDKKTASNLETLPVVDIEADLNLPEQWEEEINFKPPSLDLLEFQESEKVKVSEEELKRNAELLKEKLKLFDIEIEDISVTPGPVVTLYEIVPAPGVKISRIVSLEHDIALALAARGIRIIAPIPGKSAIGVEIPNSEASLVSARSVIAKIKDSKSELPLAIGKTITGDVFITDLATMPHLLIAGSTGSGKSVGINMLITSLIYAKHPSEVKFVIIDPKKIELSFYKKLSKHYLAVSPDLDEEIITDSQNALLVLKAVESEMENRYNKLAKAGVRNIVDYNTKVSNPKIKPQDTPEMKHFKIPYIIVIIDELADLMMTSGKEVEEPITRLAQLARAVGIHLVVATQRPSVNVITGVIKANFSARIAYQVASKIDSRTILDMNGAEQLLGRGDMLFLPGGLPKPIRMQNAFISTEEVEKLTKYIYVQKGFSKRYLLPSMFARKKNTTKSFLADLDPMFEDAARVIVRHQQGSVSLLQRRLKLGYSRAARIVDQLEEAGIVGGSEGSKAREVIVENEEQLETLLRSL